LEVGEKARVVRWIVRFFVIFVSLTDTVARFELYEMGCFCKVYEGWRGDRLLLLKLQGGDRLERLEQAIRLGRRAQSIVKPNIVFALSFVVVLWRFC
jgi:hypothetical protein